MNQLDAEQYDSRIGKRDQRATASNRAFRFATDLRLILLNLGIIAISPLLFLKKLNRYRRDVFKRRRRSYEFDFHRWTCPVRAIPGTRLEPEAKTAPHVVFVAISFGEVLIAERLTSALKGARPSVRVTWAIRDSETMEAVRSSRPGQEVVNAPFEFIIPVLNWLRHLHPDVVVIIEKFWNPNLIRCSVDWGARVMVANGRMNAHESLLYKIAAPYHRWMVNGLERVCLQTQEHLRRISPVLTDKGRALVAGNVKFDLERRPLDPARLQELADWLAEKGSVPLLAVGSTEEGDEEFVLRAFQIVQRELPCALMIAPRHLKRVPPLLETIASFDLKVSLRTQPGSGAQVYVLDTMGELATAYQFATAAFIGGTLRGAGHNVVEPLEWGIPVSYGPVGGDFTLVQEICQEAGVGFRIHTPEELAAHWLAVLSDANLRRQIKANAEQLLSTQRGAIAKTVEALVEIIESDPTYAKYHTV